MSRSTEVVRFGFVRRGLWAACLAGLLAAPAAAKNQPGAPALAREVEQAAISVRVELRAARSTNDPERVRCVSGKLSQIHAQLRVARRESQRLTHPTDAKDQRHHRYLLEAAHANARDLTQAARRCDSARTVAVRVIRR